MTKRRTTHVRVARDLVDEWNRIFPGVSHGELIKISYNTSALKLESGLRKRKQRLI